jgi:uncharacterized membrane protein
MFQDIQQPQSQQPVQTTPPEVQQPAPQAVPATPPPPPIPTTQEERIWGAIAYVGFLGLLTLAMKPKSDFCKKHAAQGLFNFSAWFVLLIAVLILLWPFPAILVSMVESLLFFATLAVSILGIVKSLQSYELNIPVFSAIALKFPVDLIIGTLTGKAPEKPVSPQDQPPANTTPPPPPAQTPQQ